MRRHPSTGRRADADGARGSSPPEDPGPPLLELANKHKEEENPMRHHQDHTPGAAAKVVDPVCGMKVDPASAAAGRERSGRTFFFCSHGCAATFDTNPDHYASR
ncbi:YHS domain-containing protein [Cellulomonas hominis]